MNTATATPPHAVATMPALVEGAFTLTSGQENAMHKIMAWLVNPIEPVFVLRGYSGCGKSTLVRTFLDNLPNFMKAARLIHPKMQTYVVQLTATTNKACENLAEISGMDVRTIHSFLGLRVQTDYSTGKSTLIPKDGVQQEGYLLLIDESSYIDPDLLQHIFERTKNCKIMFIGDPAQLLAVGTNIAPVFDAKFPGAALDEVVRTEKDNPIADLSAKFRHMVNTGESFKFTPDGVYIQHMSRDDFNAKILEDMGDPNWTYKDSKLICWTNKCAVEYNNFVRNHTTGDPKFKAGDYAVCNSYIVIGKKSLKTDELVLISEIHDDVEKHGVSGRLYTINGTMCAFMPHTREAKASRIKGAKAAGNINLVSEIEREWIDLRAVNGQTINKAMGSTYNRVFIDLDDVGRCHNMDQLARMLYVGISRARFTVYLTGDLV